MFDQLSERLRTALDPLGKKGRITDEDVDRAMREVRLALLEADVNFKVVKEFTEGVRQRCLETEVTSSVDPGQQVVKVVNDELADLMGGTGRELAMADEGPTVILLAGLQGSGKTTTAAKLASMLVGEDLEVGVAACDLQRPAAIEQLANVGSRAGATVITRPGASDPVAVAAEAVGLIQPATIFDVARRIAVLLGQRGCATQRSGKRQTMTDVHWSPPVQLVTPAAYGRRLVALLETIVL